jgi:hypothetical protein
VSGPAHRQLRFGVLRINCANFAFCTKISHLPEIQSVAPVRIGNSAQQHQAVTALRQTGTVLDTPEAAAKQSSGKIVEQGHQHEIYHGHHQAVQAR